MDVETQPIIEKHEEVVSKPAKTNRKCLYYTIGSIVVLIFLILFFWLGGLNKKYSECPYLNSLDSDIRSINLMNINCSNCKKISFSRFKELRYLYISYSFNFAEHLVLSNLPHLKEVTIDTSFNHTMELDMSNLPELSSLAIHYSFNQMIKPYTFSNFPSLKKLTIDGSFTNIMNAQVTELTTLESFIVSSTSFEKVNTFVFKNSPNITNFILEGGFNTISTIEIDNVNMTEFKCFNHLWSLSLSNMPLLKQIELSSHIRYLTLNNLPVLKKLSSNNRDDYIFDTVIVNNVPFEDGWLDISSIVIPEENLIFDEASQKLKEAFLKHRKKD